jgi:hypothetical protein
VKRILAPLGAVTTLALLALTARPALALWLKVQVTANGVYGDQQITVKTHPVEKFTEVDVTLAPHPKEISPFLSAELSLIAHDEWVASVPMVETRKDGAVTYKFRVAPGAIEQSSLEIRASAYTPATSDRSPFKTAMIGQQKVEQVMGGMMYDIRLKDFLKPAR